LPQVKIYFSTICTFYSYKLNTFIKWSIFDCLNIEIQHIAYYLPEKKLSNSQLATEFGKSEEDILKITGVKNRNVRAEHQIGSDLGYMAAEKLFSNYPYLKDNIDLLIFCTEGLDYKAPTTASTLHYKLGLKESCACIDLPMGCAGFVYGLGIAKASLLTEDVSCVLFITADIPTSVIHSQDFEMRAIFGDAGVATIVKNSSKGTIGRFVFGTDGSGAEHLIVKSGSTREQIDEKWLDAYKNEPGKLSHGRMHMNGLEIARFSLKRVPELLEQVLNKNNLQFSDVDLFVFHQASEFILNALKRKCKIPDNKFYTYYQEVGNTVSCSIPIALYHADKEGKLKRGDKVVLLGFGVGFAWGGTVITY
jgi:3-oxoacyl-[acyl-carrier-protein] synthase-3